jgi:hypothetical protein
MILTGLMMSADWSLSLFDPRPKLLVIKAPFGGFYDHTDSHRVAIHHLPADNRAGANIFSRSTSSSKNQPCDRSR